jgi:exonuclease SbcC
MQQAALGDVPPPDDDVADVLPWAAVLRCTAREQAGIAAIALASAEAAHTDAQRQADSVRELYALQQRHADARRRAEAIAADRDEREADRGRLARARRAAAVEPALELREKAAREHRTAQEAEQDARRSLSRALAVEAAQRVLVTSGTARGMAPHRPEHTPLPRQARSVRQEPQRDGLAEAQDVAEAQDLAEAAADQLTAHERRAREELGSLAAAGQLEQRAAALAAERARLEREAGEDDGRLRDAAAWLDGWEQLKQRHQRRIDAAHSAAARAAGLAADRDTAARLLGAAQERDAYARSLAAAEARHSDARDSAADAREAWQDAREAHIAGLAAELAAGLKDGEACRVCGSPDHPAPASPSGRPVTRADEEAAYAAYQRAAAQRDTAQQELSHARAGRDAALAVAGEISVPELAAGHAALEAEYAVNEQGAHDVRAAREALELAESEHARRTALRRDAETRAAARTSSRDAIDQQLTDLAGQLERARGGFATVPDRRAHLEARADALARTARAVQAGQESARRLKEADSGLADAAYRAGFDTPGAAAQALLASDGHQRLEQRVQQWQHEEAAVATDLADPGLLDAAARPPADPALARAGVDTATRHLRDASAGHEAARTRCTELDRLGGQAAARAAELAPARAEYTRLRRLADLAAGTSTENKLRMELETYVLAARLEQVAATASVRLRRMSSGRYTLVHSDARASGRTKSGLGLMAVDAWTGTERDTATLSGGETFFASLALALGLADVVTDEAGGMRLDTLFIDEGFGSLDEQTLDEVLDVLDALRERDRAVGIVSHVADLRQRIPAQLQVVKGQAGSAVRQRTATARPPQG